MTQSFSAALSPGQVAWRTEVLGFVQQLVTKELLYEYRREQETGRGPLVSAYYREMASRGWNATTWPNEHGGLELSAVNRLILMDELAYAGAPPLEYAAHNIAPIIIRSGTPQNHRDWLPRIRAGEINFALGYSEAEAGTDLLNLRTTAERQGEEWVINGEKTWNSRAHYSSHEWLLARTDREVSRHRGLSIIVVPLDAPGIEIRPLWTWGDERTNQVFFNDVRVPVTNLIGEVNAGWSYVVDALDNERAAIGTSGDVRRLYDELLAYCARTRTPAGLLLRDPDVARTVAELGAEVEMQRLMCFEIATATDEGRSITVDGTIAKIWTSELRAKVADKAMEVQGMWGQLDASDAQAPFAGRAEAAYRWAPIQRFGGGANEVLRDIVAQRGLGLSRASRRLS